jgi:hypothetical protein
MTAKNRKVQVVIASALVVALAVVICVYVLDDGQKESSSSGAQAPHGSQVEQGGSLIVAKIWRPRKNPPGAPACTRGGVALDEAGYLRFQVKCKTYGDEVAYFSLVSYSLSLKPSRTLEFEGERVSLDVRGGGPGARGSCTVDTDESHCSVHAAGAFMAKGLLPTAPDPRCEGGVSMYVLAQPLCSREPCLRAGAESRRYLALGKPSGCR